MSNPNQLGIDPSDANALANALLSLGPDALRETEGKFAGGLTIPAFKLAGLMASRRCVDGAPVRRNEDGDVELMAIVRGTGKEAGKLCLIGGGVGLVKDERFTDEQGNALWVPQTNEEALRGHFRTDLGYEIEPITSWREPQYFAEDMRPAADGSIKPGMLPNPNENAHAARYLVKITNGAEAPVYGEGFGGQEATDVVWFDEAGMPELGAFGYNHGDTYQVMFQAAERLADKI